MIRALTQYDLRGRDSEAAAWKLAVENAYIGVKGGKVAINMKHMEVADGTTVEASVFMAEMAIPGLGFRDWVEVFALPMTRPSSRVLLGRSFLKRYLVTYNGPEGLFHYAEPAQNFQSFQNYDEDG